MYNRIKREKRLVNLMISLFCKDHHHSSDLCENCTDLRDYAFKKLSSCPFAEEKPVCSKCKLHCYDTMQKNKIKEVMRYAGHKMLIKYPKDSILYFYDKLKYKIKINGW